MDQGRLRRRATREPLNLPGSTGRTTTLRAALRAVLGRARPVGYRCGQSPAPSAATREHPPHGSTNAVEIDRHHETVLNVLTNAILPLLSVQTRPTFSVEVAKPVMTGNDSKGNIRCPLARADG